MASSKSTKQPNANEEVSAAIIRQIDGLAPVEDVEVEEELLLAA